MTYISCMNCNYSRNTAWNLACGSCMASNCGGYTSNPLGIPSMTVNMKVEISKEKFMSLVDPAIEKAEEKYKKETAENDLALKEFNDLSIERYKDILNYYGKTGKLDITPATKAWPVDPTGIVGFSGNKTKVLRVTRNYANELRTMKAMLSLGCCDKVTITPMLVEFFS